MSTSISAYSQRTGDNKCLGGAVTKTNSFFDRRNNALRPNGILTDFSGRYPLKNVLEPCTSPTLPRLRRYPVEPHRIYPYFPSRMSNVSDITQRQNKSSSGINTSYRDAYRPWFNTGDSSIKGVNGTICGIKRPNRESSLSIANHQLSSNKPVTSRHLTGSSSTYDRLNHAPVTELADLNLNEDSTVSIHSESADASPPLSRSVTNHLPLTSASHATLFSTPATLKDISPPSFSKQRPYSPDTTDAVNVAGTTSNSSNNSSAPRWSSTASVTTTTATTTTTHNNPSNYTSRTNLVGDLRVCRDGGTAGLNNLGNTCFMNSIIQCLSNTAPLLEYCLDERYREEINKSSSMRGTLFASYASLMKDLWSSDSRDSSVSPHQFKTQIQRFAPRFVGYSQQDAQEFLRYVLEGLHIEVNRVTKRPHPVIPDYTAEDRLTDREKAETYWKRYLAMDNSEIVDLFVGQLMSTLECTECGFKSTTFDPFWDLSLPIPKKSNVNIVDCLHLFTSKEDLDGNERPICGRCKVRRRCTKSFSIQKFPRILVLHLKRFSGERFRSKMSLLVDYPITDLNMTEFASPSCQQRSARYNLYAVSNHSGSVYAGHYTATCKHPYTHSWYDFNDSRVRVTSAQSAVSPEGYVLFYEIT
ncbi:Ubiquitin specific protease 41 [Fasciola hepatica]|uniref:Ubiquitin carboxyl-terminal hydrolase n=1 Tax=Fasciola hepatica TaxID=6192 RepID=A0A4E0R2K4_FASHE|nr:Ubiquitin specific protease 41 [Fasciola hepatica]